ncbi:helix-turn-helix transcriptional regulator [Bradyrhizobium prioriisuperbiae]|uniref:helix-turn-helix transcriptional regulator n=1 Tax=Bradyrhizobium prioriisuperbiae TaxID=2854389 RepID=UPI0028E33B45|nr:helix-turn-helix transcriptional regulator [Bradyrhizobium prioritasuperba]
MTTRSRVPQRTELAAFLKSRRAGLSPADVGLPATPRRRTPGLRREEVSHLAGIGIAWYTWLEQGREIDVSTHFLERIAQALRLDSTERAHLFTMAHNRPPPIAPSDAIEVSPTLRRMLETVAGPAYLATPSMHVLAWNTALSAVFGDMSVIPVEDRNMLWLVFASPSHRATIPDWETDARAMLARFRVEFGRHRDDPAFLTIIERLQRASHEFHRWWPEQNVSSRANKTKRFEAPGVGQMELEQSTFLVEEAVNLRLVTYTPVDEQSAGKVKQLQKEWKTRQRLRSSRSKPRSDSAETISAMQDGYRVP